MNMRYVRLGLILLSVTASAAIAESITDTAAKPWQPVDQTVEDLDPLSAGLRHIDPGNARFSDRVSLYQPITPMSWNPVESAIVEGTGINLNRRYQYRIPGMQAFFDQPSYLVKDEWEQYSFNNSPLNEGEYIEFIPADTVFNLIPEHELTPTPRYEQPLDPHFQDNRIDGRLDLRVNGRIELVPADHAYPSHNATYPPIPCQYPPAAEKSVTDQMNTSVNDTEPENKTTTE